MSPTFPDTAVLLSLMLSSATSFFVTVTLHVAVFPATVAVIVAVPAPTEVTLPYSSTVATLLSEDVHATVLSTVVLFGL